MLDITKINTFLRKTCNLSFPYFKICSQTEGVKSLPSPKNVSKKKKICLKTNKQFILPSTFKRAVSMHIFVTKKKKKKS